MVVMARDRCGNVKATNKGLGLWVPAFERVNLSEAAFAAAGNVGGTMGFMLWKQ
jgi:hypothetical protein